MTLFVGIEQASAVIHRLGLHVRDHGLLESALARPQASMMGEAAYATLELKAAALFSSLAQNYPLFDGNKRLSMILTFTFLQINGFDLTLTSDEAFDLVLKVAQGSLELDEIATALAAHMRRRG
ncbi:MAG: type II toxin-antitoxin system death-on-curing family toxin [Leucobacter sp.]